MLKIRDRRTGNERELYVIDAHHHIGEESDGKQNIPIGNNGSYEFSKKIKNDLEDRLNTTEFRYHILPDSKKTKKEFPHGLFDQFVVFPMKDNFRGEGEFMYSKSNENIWEWTSSDYHNERLLGFGRVDPTDIDTARKEFKKFSTEYSFLGLKIHPESEKITLDSKEIIQLYIDCARLNIPIIFHTSYSSDVREIHRGVNRTIEMLIENRLEEYISQLKIIIGHYDYMKSETFRYLSHPSIYAELSGLRSVKKFLEKAKEEIQLARFTNNTLKKFEKDHEEYLKDKFWELFDVSTNWSSKIMIGSDHPFLPMENIVHFMEVILNSDLSNYLTLTEIQKILGKNILDILLVKYEPKLSVINDGRSKVNSHECKVDQIGYILSRTESIDDDISLNSIEKIVEKDPSGHEENKRISTENLNKALRKARKAEILAKILVEKTDDIEEDMKNKIYRKCEDGKYIEAIKMVKEI